MSYDQPRPGKKLHLEGRNSIGCLRGFEKKTKLFRCCSRGARDRRARPERMLRAIGVEPPKYHGVGGLLLEHGDRFKTTISKELKRAAGISKRLRKERELAFYGDIDFIPDRGVYRRRRTPGDRGGQMGGGAGEKSEDGLVLALESLPRSRRLHPAESHAHPHQKPECLPCQGNKPAKEKTN